MPINSFSSGSANSLTIDVDNISTTGKENITILPSPSNRYDDLTLLPTDSAYVAPATGYYYLNKTQGIANQTIVDFQLMTTAEAEQQAIEKETERVNALTMTALDFKNVLNTFGLSDVQILGFLNSNPSILLQLTLCQNVYCGVAKSLMPISFGEITITAEMVEQAFRAKNEELTNV